MLARAGFVLAGQSAALVPGRPRPLRAARRDRDRRVDSRSIASSILSKKVAEGADALVMDVKVGSGAFLPSARRRRALARTLVALGRRLGLPVRALLTDMDQPLGDAIGNALEVREAIDVLRGRRPARRPRADRAPGRGDAGCSAASRAIAATARAGIEAAIASGAGLERFRLGVAPARRRRARRSTIRDRLPRARHARAIRAAPRAGVVTRVDAGRSGAPRRCWAPGACAKRTASRPAPAILLHAKPGSASLAAMPSAHVAFDDPARARAARPLLADAFRIQDPRKRVTARPLVLETIG